MEDEIILKRLVLVKRLYLEGIDKVAHQYNYSDQMLAAINLFLAVETLMGAVISANDQQPDEAIGTKGYVGVPPSPEQVSNFRLGDYHKFTQLFNNEALAQRRDVYEETGKGISFPEQQKHFQSLRNAAPDILGKANARSMQCTLRRLDKAFKSFFRRVKAGETLGYPRFKGCYWFHSMEFTYNNGVRLVEDGNGRLRLYAQNVGLIKVKWHRPLPVDATIKTAILKHKLDKWYVCFAVETAVSTHSSHYCPTLPSLKNSTFSKLFIYAKITRHT